MSNILEDIYELYEWWTRFFNTRIEDKNKIHDWLHSQIKTENGTLQINEESTTVDEVD